MSLGSNNNATFFNNCHGGILTDQALDALAVQNTNNCGGHQFTTSEMSNSVYGDVFAASSHDLSQGVWFQ